MENIARRFGTNPATLGADFLTQGVRTTRHPSIEFRQTPAGRMAYLRGVRLPVWLAVETVEDCGGKPERAARLYQGGRALVSKDRATLPGWIALRVAEGKEHAGVLFYDSERFKAPQVGALAKAIAGALYETRGKFRNRWITLQ